MINSLGGKRHGQYVAIMEETKCNIYFPTLWQDINDITEEVTIYIMGDTNEDVKRAITLIQKLLAQKVRIRRIKGLCFNVIIDQNNV
jgi:hypothetical protein